MLDKKIVIKVQKLSRELKFSYPHDGQLKNMGSHKLMFFIENIELPNEHITDYACNRKDLLKAVEKVQRVNLSNGYVARSIKISKKYLLLLNINI